MRLDCLDSQTKKYDQIDGNVEYDLTGAGSQTATPSVGQMTDAWQGHLAILAANRGSSRKEFASSIGDQLVNQGGKVLIELRDNCRLLRNKFW